MNTSSKTHFGMDERGLGGTHMIQQQFLTMHRKILSAEKQIDNDPPTTSMFRRPYFSKFGEYWERIKPPVLQVPAKIDTSAPVSFPLIANLYITRSRKGASPKRVAKSVSPRRVPSSASREITDRINTIDKFATLCEAKRASIEKEFAHLKSKHSIIHPQGASALLAVASALQQCPAEISSKERSLAVVAPPDLSCQGQHSVPMQKNAQKLQPFQQICQYDKEEDMMTADEH